MTELYQPCGHPLSDLAGGEGEGATRYCRECARESCRMPFDVCYAFSFGGERFEGRFPTREAALEEAKSVCDKDGRVVIYTGKTAPPLFPFRFDFDAMADHACERLLDDLPEELVPNDWPELDGTEKAALEKQLMQVTKSFLEKEGYWPPSFFTIVDIEKHTVLIEDAAS